MNPDAEDALVNRLSTLPVLKLIADGNFNLITYSQVKELFSVLDYSQTGVIRAEDLAFLAQIVTVDISADTLTGIIADCDKSGDGVISVDELYHGICNGNTGLRKYLENIRGKKRSETELSRENFIKYLNFQFDKDDACWSLPTTLLLFVIYLFLVQDHGNTSNQFWIHNALEGEIRDEGGRSNHEGPFLVRDVHDVPSWWDWASSSLCNAVLKNDLATFPQPGRMGSYNQMVGGLQVRRIMTKNVPCEQEAWLNDLYRTDSSDLSCQPINENIDRLDRVWLLYHEDAEASKVKLRNLQNETWINNLVTRVEIRGLFLNAQYGFFTVMIIGFDFQRDGFLKIRFDWQSLASDPYRHASTYILDALFLGMVLKMLYSEAKEIIPAIRKGWDGFTDYWGLWNVVDWLSIVVAFAQFGLWLRITIVVGGILHTQLSVLTPLFDTLDMRIREGQKYLSRDEMHSIVGGIDSFEMRLDDVQDVADNLYSMQLSYRSLVSFYTGVIIFRFFKAFRANPRLSIVTDTIAHGAVDLIHFFVVFFVFFMAFAVIAAVIFGPRMKDFSNYSRSIIMCWRILMGEFDVNEMLEVNEFWGFAWFFLFETLVLLVLLNMLLAIVMDTYSMVKGKQKDALTMWEQARTTYVEIQQTKGFVDLWYLICEFEDDDNPAHPEKLVSNRTLRKSFPKMSRKNAEYLVDKALDHVEVMKEDEGITLTDAIRVIGRMEKLQLHSTAELLVEIRSLKELAGLDHDRRVNTNEVPCMHCQSPISHADQLRGRCSSCGEALQHTMMQPLRRSNFRAEPSPEPPISGVGLSTNGFMSKSDTVSTRLNTFSSGVPVLERKKDGLEELIEFMKPEGLLDDRFQALERKSEKLADLCEQILHSNLDQRNFLDRLDLFEDLLAQVRREFAAQVKGARISENVNARLEEVMHTITTQSAQKEDILWRIGLDLKNFRKDLGEMKQTYGTQGSQLDLLHTKIEALSTLHPFQPSEPRRSVEEPVTTPTSRRTVRMSKRP